MKNKSGRKKGSVKPESEKITKVSWNIRLRPVALKVIKAKLQKYQMNQSEFAEKAMLKYKDGDN